MHGHAYRHAHRHECGRMRGRVYEYLPAHLCEDIYIGSIYIGSISASPTACPLRGYGRAGTQNDRLGETDISADMCIMATDMCIDMCLDMCLVMHFGGVFRHVCRHVFRHVFRHLLPDSWEWRV